MDHRRQFLNCELDNQRGGHYNPPGSVGYSAALLRSIRPYSTWVSLRLGFYRVLTFHSEGSAFYSTAQVTDKSCVRFPIANGVHRPREQHFRPGRILLFALSSSTMVFWLIHRIRISARSKMIGLSLHLRRIWVQFLPRLHPLSFPSVTLEIQLSNISLRMISCSSVVLSSSQLIHHRQMR